MALEPDTRFGTYEIVERIGSGGMGEVYRATDTSLKRDVALKVLPPDFVEDADRLARFQREAEILASLNHANIAQVYGLENADGQTAIIMELVEGPTLADRIGEGPIPPDEAMGIALQVVAALEAAHAKGIVHRDLKPANVKVTDDGIVKVLDFGISKPIDPTAVSGGTPVATTPAMTQTGVILGTAAYMSPEQARGKFVDQRTDIWAFGCLLFEMLTGQPAFGGEDVMAILARVIDRDTDLSSVPVAISPAVRETIRLCLQKDPKRRIADIRDVRLALAGEFESQRPRSVETAHPFWRRALPVVGAALVAVVLTWAVGTGLRPEAEAPLPTQFVIELPRDIALNGLTASVVAVSPRGDLIAYGADGTIFLRPIGELDAQRMLQTNGESPTNLAFSADGRWIYYTTRDRQLKRVSLEGGSPEEIAQISALHGPSLTDSGSILYTQGMRILSVPGDGSAEPEPLVSLAETGSPGEAALTIPALNDPVLLPGGTHVLVTRSRPQPDRIIVIEVATGVVTELFAGSRPRYVRSGHIVYFDGGSLVARTFDPGSLESGPAAFGDPETITSGIWRNGAVGSAMYEIGMNGALVYVSPPAPELALRALARVDGEGRISPLNLPERDYIYPTVSPDGTFVLFFSGGAHWIYDLSAGGGEPRPIGQQEGRFHAAATWLDERTVAFALQRDDSEVMEIYRRRIDSGTADVQVSADILTEMAGSTETYAHHPQLTPDGSLAFSAAGLGGDDIYTMALPDDELELLVSRTDVQNGISFSPDGRYMAYNSIIVGDIAAVVVEPFPPDGSSNRVSMPGVHSLYPVWTRAEGALGLYYQDVTNATIEYVEISESMTVTDRRTVVSYPGLAGTRAMTGRYLDTIPDTDEILIRWRQDGFADAESPATRIIVFQHFTELLNDVQ